MTPRQAELLEFIKDYWGKHPYGPSVVEMGKHMNTSTGSVWTMCQALIDEGLCTHVPKKQRSIKPVEHLITCPECGHSFDPRN